MGGAYAGWRGHVIVCGLHGVGLRIVELLNASGVPAVVIDDHPDLRLARNLIGWGIPHIAGSSRSPETLAEAGLAGAGAVICAQEDDLRTLETALLTRELRADVRVVVQLSNPAVGRALSRIAVSVLDVAGLSAPSIVEACLRTGVQEIRLAAERFAAARTVAPSSATLRELYGALAPIAVRPGDGGDVVLCPGRDHRVAAGDGVTLIGTPDELRVAGVTGPHQPQRAVGTRSSRRSPSGPGSRPSRPVRAVAYLRHLVVSLLNAVDRRLVIALFALFAVVIGSTMILRLAYRLGGQHIPLLDAAYFTVETVTTVGYGDFSFRNQSPWLMGGAILLMLLGALFVAVFFAMLTNMLVSRRIEESLGRRRITGLRGHVLVIGLGAVGMQAASRLVAAGSDVVVVEKNDGNRHLSQARALGVPVVIADATLPETLESVSLASASAVAVLTSDDLANLETGLAVRDQLGARWEHTPVVLRMFDPQLARSVRHNFGFRNVRSTAALAAPWFVGAALGLDILNTFYVGDEPLLVARLKVTRGGGLDGLAMRDLDARTRILAISRTFGQGYLEHPPRRGTRLRAGDEAYLIGPYEELLAVLRRDRPTPGLRPPRSPDSSVASSE
ncbi:MAG: Calcium-gated potassium channel mthK [Actinomycetia bacterium]|nr:Calcium-gated potassium channel mthK [Actinomycetes bacterium]